MEPSTLLEKPGHRFIELDSLRGLAALTVVICHFGNLFLLSNWFRVYRLSPLHFLGAGHEAVMLFFLLSGFVLAVPYSRRKPAYKEFLIKRVCRIYLPYAAAITLAIVGDYFFHHAATGNPWLDRTWLQPITLSAVVQHFLFFGVYNNEQFNTAIWSLIHEMRISVVFPFIYWISLKIRTLRGCVWLFVGSLLAREVGIVLRTGDIALTVFYASFFIVGILVHRHLSEIDAWLREVPSRSIWLLVISIPLFECPEMVPTFGYGVHLNHIVEGLQEWLELFGAMGVMICAMQISWFRHFLHKKTMVWLGNISYSTYLVHGTLIFILVHLFYGRVNFAYIFPFYFVCVYLVSQGFHAWIEEPSRLLGRHLTKR